MTLYTLTDTQKINKERFSYEYSARRKMVNIVDVWDSHTHKPKVGIAIEGWNFATHPSTGEMCITIMFFTEEYGRVWFHFDYERMSDCGVMVIA